MGAMIDKVNVLLEKYNGGEIFFDELDSSIRLDEYVIGDIYRMVDNFANRNLTERPHIIASGKTGVAIHNYGKPIDLLLPGGLRKFGINLEEFAQFIRAGHKYVFVDDSYFLGRTEARVKELVKGNGGEFLGTFVAYDGCQEKRPWVHSLYRYYDYYDVLGRRIRK